MLMEEPQKKKTYIEEDIVMRWEQTDATCVFRYSKAALFLDTPESELAREQKCRRQDHSVRADAHRFTSALRAFHENTHV